MPSSASASGNDNDSTVNTQSIVLSKLIEDPQMKEMIVMEYEKFTPRQLYRRLKYQAKKRGNILMPNWLSLLLCNLCLVLLFGLIGAAIMLALNPPGKENSVTAPPLKTNLGYNETCYSFDSSCNQSLNLWCINHHCQCYNQLYYWNVSTFRCVQCPATFYYNGSECVCPSTRYLQAPANNTCALYKTHSETCSSTILCNPTPGLYCNSGTCQCSYGYYWNLTGSGNSSNGYCVRYSSNTEQCNTTSCLPTNADGYATSLLCINGTCQCSPTGKWYWTGDMCTQIKTFEGTCITDQQCDGTLQLICNGSICICAGSTPYGTWFWNGTQCVLCPLGWLNYQIYCYYNSQTPATSSKAREYCQQYGADLLAIQSQAEFLFIQPNAAAIIGAYQLAHIGYFTLEFTRPGLFYWLNGENFTGDSTTNAWWCKAGSPYGLQPTFSYRSSATPPIQACGALQVYSGNQVCMNDWWCSASLPFICKKSQ